MVNWIILQHENEVDRVYLWRDCVAKARQYKEIVAVNIMTGERVKLTKTEFETC